MSTDITVIGTGNMGGAIAERLLAQGYKVNVFNRTAARTERLKSIGAIIKESVADAVRASDRIIIALFDASIINAVLLTENITPLFRGRLVMNVAHTTPREVINLADSFAQAGARFSEVSVIAYPDTVRAGEAEYVIGGAAEDFPAWEVVFKTLGSKVHYVGGIGDSSKAEMAGWLAYAFQTLAVAYAVGAFTKENLPLPIIKSVLTENPVLRISGAEQAMSSMAARQYGSAQWSVDNFVSSIGLAIDYARELGMPTGVYEAVRAVYANASAKGLGVNDVAAVYEAVIAPAPAR